MPILWRPYAASSRPLVPTINQQSSQARGLVRHWPLLGVAFGDRYPLTRTGVAHGVAPELGPVSDFAGTSYYDTGSVVPLASESFTVAAWVLTNTTSASSGGGGIRNILSTETGAGSNEFVLRYRPGSTRFEMSISNSSAGFISANSTTVPVANVPYLVAGTFDLADTQVKLYVNGALEGDAATTNQSAASDILTIGSDTGHNTRLRQWSGWITAVRVWNRVLTAHEHRALYAPQTRWDLFWQPNPRAFAFVQAEAAASRPNYSMLLGVR